MKPEPCNPNDYKQLMLLQLMNGTFPVGSFHHSYGLESYIQKEKITSAADLKIYLLSYLQQNLACYEGLAFVRAFTAGQSRRTSDLLNLDLEVTAMRLSMENRMASRKTGQAFLRLTSQIFTDSFYENYYEKTKKNPDTGNYCVALGCLLGLQALDLKNALLAFLFNSVNSLIQVGVKIIPLGQTESQKLMAELYSAITNTAEEILAFPQKELSNFVPVLDIYSMQHEELYSRLYMS